MKNILILLGAFFFAACGGAPGTNSSASSPPSVAQSPSVVASNNSAVEPAIQFLIASAATDFHEHGPKGTLQFRNVRVGHVTASDGKHQYMLCGEFLRIQESNKAEWTKFATIKTSGYEQYIGDNVYCQKPDAVWDTPGDISSRLQSQLESLQLKEKPGGK